MARRAQHGDPITGRRIATILLGLSGMLVVFGVDAGLPVPRSLADSMGLLAGFLWGLGLVYLRRCEARPLFDLPIAQLPFLGLCFLALSFIPGGRGFALPSLAVFQDAVPWLILFAFVWVLPVVWLTAYGGSKLAPGRVGVLLMFDIVIGLTTAALLTDEPFGAREVIGGLFIMAATGVELLGGKWRRSATLDPRA